jgi:hypothetical protein
VTQRAKELPSTETKKNKFGSQKATHIQKREERKESSSKSTSLSFELIEQKTKEKREG